MRQATGTSLMAIAMNCGGLWLLRAGADRLVPMALVAAGTIPGVATGTNSVRFSGCAASRRAVFSSGWLPMYLCHQQCSKHSA